MDEIIKRFRDFAEDLERNKDASFGGGCVIMPPEGGGDPVQMLLLGAGTDPGEFWVLLKSRCEQQIAAADQQQRQKNAGFARR